MTSYSPLLNTILNNPLYVQDKTSSETEDVHL